MAAQAAAAVEFAKALTAAFHDILDGSIAGAYLHGSGAMGGWQPGRSDVDMLFVVRAALTKSAIARLAAATNALVCPGAGVELSVVRGPVALPAGAPPFELHLTTGADAKVVPGAGHGGDPDLVMHFAVCRARGVALLGPAPTELLPQVPRDRMLAALLEELRWAAAEAPAHYTVLNACRAAAFAQSNRMLSKLEVAEWATSTGFHASLAKAALERQIGGSEPAIATVELLSLLSETRAVLKAALEREHAAP